MSETKEEDMLQRADRWIQRLDDREYQIVAEASSVKNLDLKGKNQSFSLLLSTAMTNYQARKTDYADYQKSPIGAFFTRSLTDQKQVQQALTLMLEFSKNSNLTEFSKLTIPAISRQQTYDSAKEFLHYVDFGITSGIIIEGDALKRRLAESEQERDRLRTECEELSTELISIRALYEECQRKQHIKPIGGQNSE